MYELSLKNSVEDLSILGEWASDRAEEFGISARGIFRLQLVLEEVVTNIMKNAYLDSGEHTISVRLTFQDSSIHVSITDDGMAFDPLEYPEAVLPGTLEEAEVGGLGIHLMRRYTDACSYKREENANVLTMTICDQASKN